MKFSLIKYEDFSILESGNDTKVLDSEILQELKTLLQIDSKYPDVLQVKLIETLLNETEARAAKEREEMRTLEEFYKPAVDLQDGGGEVLNFD